MLLVPRAHLRETFKMREHGGESGIAEGLRRGDARIAQRRGSWINAAARRRGMGGWRAALAREGDADAQRASLRVFGPRSHGARQAHDGCVRCGMRRAVGSGVGRGTPARNERRVGRREGLGRGPRAQPVAPPSSSHIGGLRFIPRR